MLSARNWRTSRARPAPSAARTATSRVARLRARQLEVGDVHARDQQHEADRAEQHEQRLPDVLHHPLVQRHGDRGGAAVDAFVVDREAGRDCLQRCGGLRRVAVGLQPRDHRDPLRAAGGSARDRAA